MFRHRQEIAEAATEHSPCVPADVSTVAVLDRLQVVREGVRRMLAGESSIAVVADAESPEGLLTTLARRTPRVILINPNLREHGAQWIVRSVRTAFAESRLIAYFDGISSHELREITVGGVAGFVPQSASIAELVDAILQVSKGGSYIHASVQSRVMSVAQRTDRNADRLTARELSVLRLLCGGLSNTQIATRLGISVGTTKVYVSRVLAKLGAVDRTQAVVHSLRERIIPMPWRD
jgi:DNA-binding NarL/FixJ family response regulator